MPKALADENGHSTVLLKTLLIIVIFWPPRQRNRSLGEDMKKVKTIVYITALLLCASIGQAQTLTASQAKAHVGENATVCGTVAGEHTATRSRGEPTFINLDAPYPNQIFTILIWVEDRANVGTLPRVGSHTCATGLIKDFRGVPEIVVRSSGQLSK